MANPKSRIEGELDGVAYTNKSRIEEYIAYIKGDSQTKPDKPRSRIEEQLDSISPGGGYVPPNYIVDASIPYGGYGQKVIANLLIQDETALNSHMTSWDSIYSTYYEYENQIGAYGGYTWATPITYSSVKLWVGRFEGQNKTLTITVQTCDENGDWTDIEDFDITPSTPYPLNVFECTLPSTPIYGVRWIHKKGSYKDGGNNICFFGMKLYQ